MHDEYHFLCPVDAMDALEHVNVFHCHYVVCRRHSLFRLVYGGAQRVYSTDTQGDICYWHTMEELLSTYQGADFQFVREQ